MVAYIFHGFLFVFAEFSMFFMFLGVFEMIFDISHGYLGSSMGLRHFCIFLPCGFVFEYTLFA